MFQKTDVSNQITGLRPKVKQAMVHLAHHLTREIPKLENRKGPKAEKFHKKAHAYREEIILLKKVQPDDVSRYALMMDFNDREKLLNNVTLPLKTKVIVKLATHKPIVKHLNDFRAAHPEWSSMLPQLLENLGIRAKFKKKVLKHQARQKRKLERKQGLLKDTETLGSSQEEKNEVSEGNGPLKNSVKISSSLKEQPSKLDDRSLADYIGNSGSELEDVDASSSDGECDNNLEDADGNSSVEGSSSNLEEICELENEEDSIESEDDDNSEPEDEENSGDGTEALTEIERGSKTSKSENVPPISKGSKFAEVRRFADFLDEERQGKDRNLLDVSHDSDEKASENEPVEEDTFFMTRENRFLKTVAVKRENGEGLMSTNKIVEDMTDNDSNHWAVEGKRLKGNRAQRRAKFLGTDVKKKKFQHSNKRGDSGSSSYFSKSQHKTDDGFRNFNLKSENIGQPMSSFNKSHSNREESKDRTGFRNQRSLENSGNSFGGRNGKDSTKPNTKKVQSLPNQSNSAEKLHPSWEAKRKQKVSLDNFQGKKIKFDV